MIFLNDEQYKALLDNMGETELLRCISYLSEYCSMSGKVYKDWGAAIEKCHREGWGLTTLKEAQPSTDYQPDMARIQSNNDWLDRFLEEQKQQQEGKSRWDLEAIVL